MRWQRGCHLTVVSPHPSSSSSRERQHGSAKPLSSVIASGEFANSGGRAAVMRRPGLLLQYDVVYSTQQYKGPTVYVRMDRWSGGLLVHVLAISRSSVSPKALYSCTGTSIVRTVFQTYRSYGTLYLSSYEPVQMYVLQTAECL